MKKAMLFLLCVCLMSQTACSQKNRSIAGAQNAGVDTSNEEYDITCEEYYVGKRGTKDGADENDDVQKNPSDENSDGFSSDETWRYYFTDGDEKKLYELRFYPSSNKMEWKTGYYESEWENTFVGFYAVDEDNLFHAELYDELRDTGMQISFTVDIANANAVQKSLSLTVTAASLDQYEKLKNAPIQFTLDVDPDYHLKTSDFVIERPLTSGSVRIYIEADRQMTLKENALYDGSEEEYFRFSVLENISEDDYFKSSSDDVLYDEIESLRGETASGYAYRVYYSDVEIRKGQIARLYKIFAAVNEKDRILIDAYCYPFKDGLNADDYFDERILPVVKSIGAEYD